ncbi:MAG: acyl carrier protein [Kiritimatiellia bacterium]|jgi:acyl carrier protein
MTDAQVLDLIKAALFEVAPNRKEEFEEITLDDTIEDLALDSIATMEMVGFLEDKTENTFPDEELARVNSMGDLASLVRTGHL